MIALDAAFDAFVEGVKETARYSDLTLVASVKDPALVRFDPVHAAVMLRERLQIDVAPVVVSRDQNRPQLLSSVLAGMQRGLTSVMLAWGDDLPASSGASNVRDIVSLSDAISDVSKLAARAGRSMRVLAPVDLSRLARPRGASVASGRIGAGAELLLAQPPTTDPGETFDSHAALIDRAGLNGKVLPGVFPFKDRDDVRRYEGLFGWSLPARVHDSAASGRRGMVELERQVVGRLKDEGFPGVYFATRGAPETAREVLS